MAELDFGSMGLNDTRHPSLALDSIAHVKVPFYKHPWFLLNYEPTETATEENRVA